MKQIKIGIAEDHSLVRKGFIKMLADFPHIKVVFEAQDGEELIEMIHKKNVEVILLDIKMPNQNGHQVLTQLKEMGKNVKVIVISAFDNDSEILECVRLGAASFLPKHTDIDTLVSAIHDVLDQGFYFDIPTLELLDKNRLSPLGAAKKLNQKEVRILKLLCENMSSEDIAKELGISHQTVRWYKHNILHKTNTDTMRELLLYAISHKYVSK